ncbi:MAG: alpha/beta fold hydrolase [Gammaproteobacteria bacterium]|nr:alpha/beta fold hydrolase [Gammaproteobacteria bacterium]MBU1483050.1 alpha/beta fold hydrolase [Gammaproteobacteria bacterium]
MRKALQLDIAGHRLFGTLHDRAPLPPQSGTTSERIGVLLMSFGQQPRSWVGDLGSSIADRLEEQGYPTFRFDMPGLGDSPGDIPVHLEELWRDILSGAHEVALHALCEDLVRRFSLKGLVVGGFCGGAVTALYAINSRSPQILGLVLLEPEIALVRTSSPSTAATPAPLTVDSTLEVLDILKTRICSLESWRRLLKGNSDLKFWGKLWYGLLDFTMRKLSNIGRRKKLLPPETNHRMLNAWLLARRLRIPTLVVSVGTPNRSKYYQAYGLQPGVADLKSALQWIEIPNTTHAMLTGGAKEAVGKYTEAWISENFPLGTSKR